MVKTKVIEENDEKITILLSDVDRAFVNAIRRTLISDTPKMAIDTVRFEMGTIEQDGEVWESNGPLPDEVVAQRLAMIPIPTKHDEFHFQDSCPSCAELVVEDRGCPLCTMIYTCKAFGSEGGRTVTAGDMSFLGAGGNISEKYHSIPITKLSRGQMIEFYATAIMGRGRDHAKWSPVCGVSFVAREEGKKNDVGDYCEKFWDLDLRNSHNDWNGDSLDDHFKVQELKKDLNHLLGDAEASAKDVVLYRTILLPGRKKGGEKEYSKREWDEMWGNKKEISKLPKLSRDLSEEEREFLWNSADEETPIWTEEKPNEFVLTFETDGSMSARTAFEKAIDELSAQFGKIRDDSDLVF